MHTLTLPEARYTVPIFPLLILGACHCGASHLYARAPVVFDKPRKPL